MAESSAEDRTEAPTARRLQMAREEGQLPLSRDVPVLAGLVGAAFGAVDLVPAAARHLSEEMTGLLGSVGGLDLHSAGFAAAIARLALAAFVVVGAAGGPAALCVIASVLLQSGFYVGGPPIHFDPARISPRAGLARVLSFHNLFEFLKSCARLAILATVIWAVLGRDPFGVIAAAGWDLAAILPATIDRVEDFARPLLVALAALAGFDIFMTRMRHARQLRMTRQEVRLEMRDSDGDPFIKAKLKRLRAQRARRRMMEKVKTADVVVTNPTHYAVALSYDRQRNAAPRIVAKGVDFIAQRIREEAAAHNVPLMPNPPLARALYQVELDREIPPEHYQAVAEVIAYVWKIRNRLAAPVR
jgi:flagellar biosynthetic protein FlhB